VLTAKRKQFRIVPRPFCPVCRVEMRVYCTSNGIRYCRCPVVGCTETTKEIVRAAHSDTPPSNGHHTAN
jgi:hypothetical protein